MSSFTRLENSGRIKRGQSKKLTFLCLSIASKHLAFPLTPVSALAEKKALLGINVSSLSVTRSQFGVLKLRYTHLKTNPSAQPLTWNEFDLHGSELVHQD